MKSIQNKETEFRVVLFPASAKTGGEEDQLARGFWCASQQSKEAAINFHRYAVSRPQKNSSGRATDAEEISRIVDAAAGFGIDQQRLQACLVSESTAKDSAGRVQRLTKAEIGPGPKLYINKREVLLSNMLEIDDVISSLSSAMNIGQK
jgi:type IV pilus biogenesis protein CpaD/CtpE